MTVRGYRLGFDWSRHGTYANVAEDATSSVTQSDLTIEYGRDTSQTAPDLSAGTLNFDLDDRNEVYSDTNLASPIAGKIMPGVPGVLGYTYLGLEYRFFDGILDAYESDDEGQRFTGSLIDAWGAPGAELLSTPVYQGQRTGDLVHVVLDAIGWTGPRDIDPGSTVIAYWWEEDGDASSAIQRLIDAEGPPAIAYVKGGTFVFRDRHHRITRTASMTSQGLYTQIEPQSTGPAGDVKVLRGEIKRSDGMRRIVNSVVFNVDQREPRAEEAVWSTDTPIVVSSGETIVINAKASDPFVNAQTPILGTDYVMTTGSVNISISRTSGQSVLLSITGLAGSSTVASVQVRATPIPVVRTVKVTAEDASSIGSRGRQTWPRELPWANQYDAFAIAQRIVATYANPRPVFTITIDGDLGPLYLQQFVQRDISDRITLRADRWGVNTDFIVEKVIRTIKALGARGHHLTIVVEPPEPVQPANIFTFDTPGKGFNDGKFGVDGIDSAANVFRFDVPGQGFNDGRFAT
jgi:hypothetical protein